MKPAPLLLAGSLVANVALFCVLVWQPALAPPLVRDFFQRNFHAADDAPAMASTPPAAARATEAQPLWTALKSEDLGTFVARLRAAGFPASVIRQMVQAEVSARYDPRIRAIMEPDPNVPFWKQPSSIFNSGDKRLEEYTQLQRERAKILRDLFKDDFFASGEVTAAQRRQFGDLPRSIIDQIQRVEDDYGEMISAVRAGMKGITLPEDREKLALLNREKRADLAAILTPAELSDYEMRSSRLTSTLITRFGVFEPSEAEFRGIFQAYQALGEKFSAGAGPGLGIDYQQRQTAQQTLDDQIRTALGPARYAEYVRETNSDFQQLSRLVQRDNLPVASAVQAFNLRDSVSTESNRIVDDATLDVDQKRAALQTLAQNTRHQILGTLGPVSGPAYVKVADQWLATVERGSAVTFTGGATMIISSDNSTTIYSSSPTNFRSVTNPRPNPPPNPAPGP